MKSKQQRQMVPFARSLRLCKYRWEERKRHGKINDTSDANRGRSGATAVVENRTDGVSQNYRFDLRYLQIIRLTEFIHFFSEIRIYFQSLNSHI